MGFERQFQRQGKTDRPLDGDFNHSTTIRSKVGGCITDRQAGKVMQRDPGKARERSLKERPTFLLPPRT